MKRSTTQRSAKEKKTAKIWGKVPERIKERLEDMATAEKRSVSFYVREFVTEGLERMDQQKAA